MRGNGRLGMMLVMSLFITSVNSWRLVPLSSETGNSSIKNNDSSLSRRQWMIKQIATIGCTVSVSGGEVFNNSPANAAPPIAIIAEELGYFPVRNKDGDVMYIPKKITQSSTEQAIELTKIMNKKGITMYGAYWCPHCARQRELFGKEAWSNVSYVECSPKGFGFNGICKDVDGYPTFKDTRGKVNVSGEQSLAQLAKLVGMKSFDPSLEASIPLVGTACKLPKPTQ